MRAKVAKALRKAVGHECTNVPFDTDHYQKVRKQALRGPADCIELLANSPRKVYRLMKQYYYNPKV